MPSGWNDPDLPPSLPSHLRATFESARDGHLGSLDALRSAVSAYVDELRAKGVGKDEVDEAVRELFQVLDRSAPVQSAAGSWNARLVDTMVQWGRDRWNQPGAS